MFPRRLCCRISILVTYLAVLVVFWYHTTGLTLRGYGDSKDLGLVKINNSSSVIAKKRITGGPLGRASSVLVVQVADEDYAAKMKSKMDTNRQWADCMNNTYQLKTISKASGNVYTEKVKAIHDAVELSSGNNGWVIFLDGDVSFRGDSCDALEQMIPAESVDHQPCEFIAMSSANTINTGVILMRSTDSTKELMRSWLVEQQRPDTLLSFGAADQLSLQEAVLRRFLGATYSGRCMSMGDQEQRNLCFKEHMPEEYRFAQNVCLLPCNTTIPLQCNDCRGECNRTASIFHHDSKRERYLEKHGLINRG